MDGQNEKFQGLRTFIYILHAAIGSHSESISKQKLIPTIDHSTCKFASY